MKRKGITIWEQHVEHIVLGLALLFFVGFTVFQVISSPNTVERPGRTVSPGDVDDLLRETAFKIQGKLEPTARAEADIPDPKPLLTEFSQELQASVTPTREFLALAPPVNIGSDTSEPTAGALYTVPSVPAPYSTVAQQFFDGLDPAALDVPELAARFEEAPYDLTWVTAAAYFDVSEVLEQYRSAAEGESPIPMSWYREIVEILDLRVEREELVDGVWTNLTLLEPIPGQVTFRAMLAGEVTKRDVEGGIRDQLAGDGMQEDIIRPEFYPTVSDSWAPPNPAMLMSAARDAEVAAQMGDLSEEQQQILRLTSRLRSAERRRAQQIAAVERLGGTVSDDDLRGDEEEDETPARGGDTNRPGAGERQPAPPNTGSGRREPPKAGGRQAPGAGFSSGGPATAGSGSGDAQADREKIERLLNRVRIQSRRIASLQAQLAAIGAFMDEAHAADDDDRMLVWAHDLTVDPEKSYRYRFTVDVYNPFWGKKLFLREAQRELAEAVVMSSDTSEWSAPIRIMPDRNLFVTKAFGPEARLTGQSSFGQASVEVYRFSNGRWWKDTFNVEPGDLVGGVRSVGRGVGATSIDFETAWFVLEIIEDDNADRTTIDRGEGAWVRLMSTDGMEIVPQDPARASGDPERLRLDDEVEAAEAELELTTEG